MFIRKKFSLVGIAVFFTIFLSFGIVPKAHASQTIEWGAPDGVLGWCTARPHGDEACFSDPQTSCEDQYNSFGSPYGAQGPVTAIPGSKWYIFQCRWNREMSDPWYTTIYFRCAAGYFRVFSGPNSLCKTLMDIFKIQECGANGGGQPNPWTLNPINILTGAKRFEVEDYTSTDGSFGFIRRFVSMQYAGIVDDSIVGNHFSFSNWHSPFDMQIQIGPAWNTTRVVTILDPNGGAQNYLRQSNGSLTPYTFSSQPVPNMSGKMTFIGTWPTDLNTLTSASTQWQYRDEDNNLWTFQTRAALLNGLYNVAYPTLLQRPDGTTLTFAYASDNRLVSVTDQAGKVISFEWNEASIVETNGVTTTVPTYIKSMLLPGGYKVSYLYETLQGVASSTGLFLRLKKVDYLDSSGALQDSITYQAGDARFSFFVTEILNKNNTITWTATYDSIGRAVSSSGSNGEMGTTVSYGSSGNTFTRTQTDALGRQTVYTFTRSTGKNNIKLVSVDGLATASCAASNATNTFGTDNLLATSTDEEGHVTKYTRNSIGQPTQITEAFGTVDARTTDITWHSSLNAPTHVISTGLTTDYTYDTLGRVLTVTLTDTTTHILPYVTNGRTRTWTYTYGTTGGAIGKLVSIDGPMTGTGDTVSYGYNVDGYLSSITDEVGKVTAVTAWDWRGAPLTVVDPNNVQTTFTYDIHGRVLSSTINPGASQSQFSYEYDVAGNLTKITLPLGGYLSYTYDIANRLTGVGNDKGETITITPNLLGDPTSSVVKTSDGVITQQQSYVYDEMGRLLQSIGAVATQKTQFAYDKLSNLKTTTDGRGKVWSNSFDALERVIVEANPESQSVGYSYNAQDELTKQTDGRGLQTTRTVDGFGLTIQEVSPERGTRKYWYDNAGRLTKIIDGDDEETNYSYDLSGRLLTATFPTSAGENTTYTYDAVTGGNKGNGRLTSVTEASGSTAFVYDAQGRILNDTKVIEGKTYVAQYSYDANSALKQITLPSGRIVFYARNSEGQIISVKTKVNATGTLENLATNIAYKPFGPMQSLTYGNGLSLTRTYDQNYWQTRQEVKATGVTILDLGFQYYDDGRLGEIDDNAATGRTVFIALSDAGRLSYASGPWGNESYTYDASGNRTGAYTTVGGTTTTQNEVVSGSSNRLAKTTDANGTTVRTLTYRQGGDLYTDARAGGATFTYLYNARKRLVAVKQDTTTVANYGYDFQGHRVSRTIFSLLSTTKIHYVYDIEGRLLGEYDGNTGAPLREYAYVGDMPLAVIDTTGTGPNTYFIHTGRLNEPQVMTNAAKAKVWDAYVKPYGKAQTFASPTVVNDFRLPGQWHQLEAAAEGLSQNHFRDYDPTLGRYIEADPLGIDAGQNVYAYVDGRPYDDIDPTGQCPWCVAMVASAAAGAAIDYIWQVYIDENDCVNWKQVAISGGIDGLTLGFGKYFKAARYSARATKYLKNVEILKNADVIKPVNNFIRNPHGRRGSPAHRNKILQAQQRLEAKKWEVLSGGDKKEVMYGKRYPDLVMAKDGKQIAIQVGRLNASGKPVTREVNAMNDLRATGKFKHVFFISY